MSPRSCPWKHRFFVANSNRFDWCETNFATRRIREQGSDTLCRDICRYLDEGKFSDENRWPYVPFGFKKSNYMYATDFDVVICTLRLRNDTSFLHNGDFLLHLPHSRQRIPRCSYGWTSCVFVHVYALLDFLEPIRPHSLQRNNDSVKKRCILWCIARVFFLCLWSSASVFLVDTCSVSDQYL